MRGELKEALHKCRHRVLGRHVAHDLACLSPCRVSCFFLCLHNRDLLSGFEVQPSSTKTPSRTICRTEIACEHTPRAFSIACAQLPRPQSPDAGNAAGGPPFIERTRWSEGRGFQGNESAHLDETCGDLISRDNLRPRCDRTFAHDGVNACRMHFCLCGMHYCLTSHQEEAI